MTPKTTLTGVAAIGALALPSLAGAHGKPTDKPTDKPVHGPKAPHQCVPHKVGYVAAGTLAAPATLTQTAGADTPTDPSDDRYSGTLTVTVTRGNHHAKGVASPVTVQATNIRLGAGVTATPPAGTRVRLIGKVTKVSKRCGDQSGAGVVTVRKAILRVAKA